MAIKIPDDVSFTGECTFSKQPVNIHPASVVSDGDTGVLWDDFRVAGNTTRRGDANKPAFAVVINDGNGSIGVYADKYSASSRQDVFFSMQMPHSWKLGSEVKPHVHWIPLDDASGNVVFEFEYTIAEIGDTFPNTTITTVTAAAGGKWKHTMTYLMNGITPNVSSVSSMWLCRLSRKADDAADTYTGKIAIIEFDIHYQIDRHGSRGETEK